MGTKEEKLAKYPKTEMYRVIDTIGVPHPYCITAKHVVVASNHYCGMLGKDAIRGAEKTGVHCGIKGCNLSYDQHEQALLVEVGFKGELKDAPGLKEYLLTIKEMAEADKFAGFAFIRK
jgi:hypothetical protein